MFKKFSYYLSLSIGALLFAGLSIINRLAYKKGGVNHHLLYRKNQYLKGLFSSPKLVVFSIGCTLLALLMLYLLFRGGNRREQIARGLALFYSLAFILCSYLEYTRDLIVYPYLLISILLSLGASLIASCLAREHYTR